MPVNPRGEETATALRAWATDEIKEAPQRSFELGKFLFGTSTGSVGLFITVSKFANLEWHETEWSSAAAFALSSVCALGVLLPRLVTLRAETDLAAEHTRSFKLVWRASVAWFALWIVGVVLAIIAVNQ